MIPDLSYARNTHFRPLLGHSEAEGGFEPVRMRFLVILGNFVTTLFANRAKSVLMTVWFELSSAIIR